VPFSVSVSLGSLPAFVPVDNMCMGKIDWSNLNEEDLKEYYIQSDILLNNIVLPKVSMACSDNCKDPQHGIELCTLYENIVKSLLVSSKPL